MKPEEREKRMTFNEYCRRYGNIKKVWCDRCCQQVDYSDAADRVLDHRDCDGVPCVANPRW